VRLNEELVEKLTVPKDAMSEGQRLVDLFPCVLMIRCFYFSTGFVEATCKKTTQLFCHNRERLLFRLADLCMKQGEYHLACRKYTQAGDKEKVGPDDDILSSFIYIIFLCFRFLSTSFILMFKVVMPCLKETFVSIECRCGVLVTKEST